MEEKLELIQRNTVEIVTKEEMEKLIADKARPIVYCGYEPSGPAHLGHFMTMVKLMDFEKAGFKVKILLADVHAFLNRKSSQEELSKTVDMWRKTIKAIGLNADVILGSDFQFEREYQLEVMELARIFSINRGLRSMAEIARDIKNATISQIWYPLMQVIDIKYLDVDVAEGGLEQRKVHMIGREAVNITKHPFIATHTPLICSLKGPGEKMSKSSPGSGISITDTQTEIEQSIKNAYCPLKEAKNNPILDILRYIVFPLSKEIKIERPSKFGGDICYGSYDNLEKDYINGALHPMDLKNTTAQILKTIINPIREKCTYPQGK
jgi:tyrosyl-tRNA synthetase